MPLDALIVINALNNMAGGDTTINPYVETLDVTGDGDLSPLDALVVINALNAMASGAGGEGEEEMDVAPSMAPTMAPTLAQSVPNSADHAIRQLYDATVHDWATRNEWTQKDHSSFVPLWSASSLDTHESPADRHLNGVEDVSFNDLMNTLVEDRLRAAAKSKNQFGKLALPRLQNS